MKAVNMVIDFVFENTVTAFSVQEYLGGINENQVIHIKSGNNYVLTY